MSCSAYEYQRSSLFSITNKIIKFEENLLFIVSSDALSQDCGNNSFPLFLICSAAADSANRAQVSARHTAISQNFVRRFWRATMLQTAEAPDRRVSYATMRSVSISFCFRFAIHGTLSGSVREFLIRSVTTIRKRNCTF